MQQYLAHTNANTIVVSRSQTTIFPFALGQGQHKRKKAVWPHETNTTARYTVSIY